MYLSTHKMTNLRYFIAITLFVSCNCRPKMLENSDMEANSKKALSIDKLQPPDHLEAVRFEQDGMLNKDFHKEAFIGNHEEIDDEPSEVADSKLKDIFNKVDTDADGKMSLAEMEHWIQDKIRQHFDEALEENTHIFKHMDPDGDGLIDWKEYYKHFLIAKNYHVGAIDDFLKDYADERIELKESDRDQLVRYKFRWTDAEQMPMDNKLNKEEFLAFRHPEQSKLSMVKMVEMIINSLDADNNGELSEKEFIALPPGDVEDAEQRKMDEDWQKEREKEFKRAIDADHNGIATKEELVNYIDPRNPEQSNAEALNLLQMLDDDKDGKVSMDEMFKHKDIFVNSKVVNVKKSLHDEF